MNEALNDKVLRGALPALAEAFRLGEVREHCFLADGLMNLNWRVITVHESYAVKQITDVPVVKVRRNLGVLSGLADDGLPVPAALSTASGDTVVEIGGHSYCVLPWIAGTHIMGTDLPVAQVRSLGELLARLHEALSVRAPAPVPAEPPAAKVTSAATAAENAARLRALIPDGCVDPFDRAAARALEQRQVLLAKYAGQQPDSDVPAGPFGWTHGDFQYRNILRSGGEVVAVLDWDRLAVRPYAEEVARTAQVQFGVGGRFDLDRVAAFVSGYRTRIPLTSGELADGVHRLWWKRLTDFWQLEFHYDRGDSSCDQMFLDDEALLHWWTDRFDKVQAAYAVR